MKKLFITVVVLFPLVILLGACTNVQSIKGQPALDHTDQQKVRAAFTGQRRIAVLVGINSFDDSRWNRLKYAEKDANDMATVLNDTRYGNFDKVITLTGSRETTKSEIMSTLNDLSFYNSSQSDTVIFYISTHGTLARTVDGKMHQYLVTRDTRFDDISDTAIDIDDLRTIFNRLPSQKKVMIVASCHSGKGKSQLNDNLIAELNRLKSPFFVKPIEKASEATIVLAASSWGEAAREDNVLQNDVYTHFLIEGIKNYDRNGDGAVTVTEAHDYAKQQTYYLTKGEQRPSMESVILGVDPIILAGEVTNSGKPVLYDYSKHYEDMIVFVDGEKKGTLPLGVALDPGAHLVELKADDKGSSLYSEMFMATAGEQISLPLLIHGYDQGLSLRAGYSGFLTDEIDKSVAKPMPVIGISYAQHAYFKPRLGFRADLFYGQDTQTLDTGLVTATADVTQTSFGLAMIYWNEIGGATLYGGPRVGGLYLTRDFGVSFTDKEDSLSPVVGGLFGLSIHHKQKWSFALEGSLNYTNIDLSDTNGNAIDYNLFGNLSLNF